jgi:hypothetical protein
LDVALGELTVDGTIIVKLMVSQVFLYPYAALYQVCLIAKESSQRQAPPLHTLRLMTHSRMVASALSSCMASEEHASRLVACSLKAVSQIRCFGSDGMVLRRAVRYGRVGLRGAAAVQQRLELWLLGFLVCR